MRRPESPALPEHYCVRSFRNRALEPSAQPVAPAGPRMGGPEWFEPSPAEKPGGTRQAMRCLLGLPASNARSLS